MPLHAVNKCSVIMYHFVRDLPHTRYPKIKGLLVSQFINQLNYLERYYKFVTVQDCIESIYSNTTLPDNAVLLTFDDGYIDHFMSVFPILNERKIQGCFFHPAKALVGNEVLDVNKIHFILAAVNNVEYLLNEIYRCLDEYRAEYGLKGNSYYFNKLAHEDKYDSKEVIFIKRLLQKELDGQVKKLILNRLFSKYVTSDEKAFARELYMSIDQIKHMAHSGMYIGNHGYDHLWLNILSREQQEKEIDLSLNFFKKLGLLTNDWVMSYPYGAYNDSLIGILKKKNCKLGFLAEGGIAKLTKDNAFTLARFDTNDFPK